MLFRFPADDFRVAAEALGRLFVEGDLLVGQFRIGNDLAKRIGLADVRGLAYREQRALSVRPRNLRRSPLPLLEVFRIEIGIAPARNRVAVQLDKNRSFHNFPLYDFRIDKIGMSNRSVRLIPIRLTESGLK